MMIETKYKKNSRFIKQDRGRGGVSYVKGFSMDYSISMYNFLSQFFLERQFFRSIRTSCARGGIEKGIVGGWCRRKNKHRTYYASRVSASPPPPPPAPPAASTTVRRPPPARPIPTRLYLPVFALGITRHVRIRHDLLGKIHPTLPIRQSTRVIFCTTLDDGTHLQYLTIERVRRLVEFLGIEVISIPYHR
jgi:hypothetical protein